MHPYERHMLSKLTLRREARYRDLKPEGAESNLFAYHLKNILQQGFIRKGKTGYVLTAAGGRYVEKLSLASFKPRFQPKIVTVIICKNTAGKYLVYTRKRQPLYGLKGFPYGKIHFGEKILAAAEREIKEKTGLSAPLVHKGDMYLTIHQKGELLAYMLCHVFSGRNPNGSLREYEYGESAWADMRNINPKEFIPGFLDMFNLVQKPKYFFEERSFEL
jgi:ADP-ribose pyrophosphatase YjhB (NUDIX family)